MRSSSLATTAEQDLDKIINFLSETKPLEAVLALLEAGKAAPFGSYPQEREFLKKGIRGRLPKLAERKREVFKLLAQLLR